jgi:hypothetical protein
MTKPLGYYCAVTPGDGSFLDELQERYGSTFENLTKLQKLYILKLLTTNLLNAEVTTKGSMPANQEVDEITDTVQSINQRLTIREHLSLADAIVNQLKHHRG